MSDYNQFPCDTNYLPSGQGSCVSDLTVISKIFLVKDGFSFATLADAQDETKWDTAIQDGDLHPMPLVFSTENADEEAVFDTGSAGKQHKIRDGKAVNTYNLINTLCGHIRIRSFDQFSGGYYAVDENGNVLGTTSDGVKFEPITIDTCNVNKLTASDGSNARYTPVYIVDANPSEFNDRGASFKVTWNIKGKDGLLPVKLTIVGTPSATEIVVNAVTACDGSPVSGLETGTDWIVGIGSVTSSAESATILGQYTLTGTGFATSTLNLGDPSILSVTGYASVGAITLTV
jgi:hypothetical protein